MSGTRRTDLPPTDNSSRADMRGTGAGAGVELDETHRLIAADKVEGTAVYNPNGDSLGSIHGLMIDKISGKVSYAVMSFGGFLGIGERYHPLPWDVLTFDTRQGGYVVDLTREQLEGAPSYAVDERPWDTPGYGRRIYDYYGLPYI
jgi:hypothetical protein